MSRLCERPGCAEPASVAYGFDPAQRMLWFAVLGAEGPDAGRICRRHADAMVLPNGWWLDDRRGGDALFAPAEPEVALPPPKPKRARKPKAPAPPRADDPAAPPEPGSAEAPAWMPAFDTSDDLGGQLDADTPLLSRAFGGSAPLPKPTPSRRRRPPAPAR